MGYSYEPDVFERETEFADDGKTVEECPKCSKMKVWKRGKWGSRFLACSGFPKCRWVSYEERV